jgi:hypothetical protein
MMKNSTASADHDLRALAVRFAHWRRTRAVPHERIPTALWDQAATLSTVLPLSRVAQTLRLSRGALKAHRATSGKARAPQAPPAARGFVEVTATPAAPALASGGVEVEVTRPDGRQLRIHFREASPPLAAVVRAFLGEV